MTSTRVLRSYAELALWAAGLSLPVYITVGFFDGVHLGHRHLISELKRCAAASDAGRGAATLAITFANSPKNYHRLEAAGEGGRSENFPHWHYLTTADEKLHLLGGLGLDAVLMLDYGPDTAGNTAAHWLRMLDTQLRAGNAASGLAGVVLGYDTTLGSDQLGGPEDFARLARDLSIEIGLVPAYDALGQHVKSSRIRQMLVRGDLDGARALLGAPWFALGTVARGKGKGREMLGIPTANVYLPADKLTPPGGIYAGLAEHDGRCYPAALCLVSTVLACSTVLDRAAVSAGAPNEKLLRDEGVVLTDSQPGGATQVIEAHLVGFSGELYSQQLKLDFLRHLRGWQDFDSIPALQQRMQLDIRDSIAVARRAGIHCLEVI